MHKKEVDSSNGIFNGLKIHQNFNFDLNNKVKDNNDKNDHLFQIPFLFYFNKFNSFNHDLPNPI